jgi:serine protease
MKTRVCNTVAVLCAALILAFSTFAGFAADRARVWVQFVPGQKAAVLGQLQAVGGTVHYQFDELEAIAVTLPEPALQGITRNPNVVLVEEDPVRYLFAEQTPYGITMVQASDVWTATPAGTGSGVIVGVIDSGVYRHEDLPWQRINGEASGTGLWNNDGLGHGTHVVGTILAAKNNLGVVGVAPEASVYMVKVFGDDGAWTYSSTLVYAVGRAVDNDSKIISMSLGGDFKSVTEQRAFDKHYSNGILLVAAAGNKGSSRMSYPASYSSVISVAAVDETKTWASFSQYNSQVELAAPGVGVLSTVPYIDEAYVSVDGITVDGAPIEFAATGTATGDLVDGGLANAKGAWSGKVVLVQRGDNSFYDKVMNVQNSGGVAAVIYNNVDGPLYATLGTGNSSTIPAIGITKQAGEYLQANKLNSNAKVVNTHSAPASGYAYYDGTSMATPHVSGVAALLWSAFPTAMNSDIRAAMQKSAEDLGTAGKDNYYGYGLVQAKAAYDLLLGSTPPPPVTEKTIYVSDITMNLTVAGKNAKATAKVTIVDQNSAFVGGATVSGTWSGLYNGSASATTDASGVATFISGSVKATSGTFTFTVTGVILQGASYVENPEQKTRDISF